jgi:hypothetical protein
MGVVLQGYGPCHGRLLSYPDNQWGNPPSRKLSQLRRPTQLWRFGDVGLLKEAWPDDTAPKVGYYTVASFPTYWKPGISDRKQPAVRHDNFERAVFVACDGHVEKMNWEDLRDNKNDYIGRDSL